MVAIDRSDNPTTKLLPVALLISVGVLFGLQFSINKIAVEAGVPPIGFTFWQSLGAGLALLVMAMFRGQLPMLSVLHLRTYGVSGALGIGVPISLLAYVAPQLPASVVTLVLMLSPPLTYLFSLLLRMESFRWLSLAGIFCGMAGVLLVVLPGTSLPEPGMVGWLLLAFLAPVCFACVNVYAGRFRPPAAPSLMLACGVLLASAVFLAPIMVATGQAYLFPGPELSGDLAVLGAVLLHAVFWVMFFEIVRLAGPVFFSQFNFIAVLAGIGWAILIFGDRPSVYIWGALVLLFAGLALIIWSMRRAQAS